MYRVIYVFPVGELYRRLDGLVDGLYARKPALRKWSHRQIILAWVRYHLYEDSYLILGHDPVDSLREELDWQFLSEQRCLTNLYGLVFHALIERSERLFHVPCSVRLTDHDLYLQFDLDERPPYPCQRT